MAGKLALLLALLAPAEGFRGRRAPTMVADGKATWQSVVRRLARPDISLVERQTLTFDLLKQGPDVADTLTRAVRERNLETLVEDDPEGQEILAGVKAVRRQIVEDIIPDLQDQAPEIPTKVAAALRKSKPPTRPDLASVQSALQDLRPDRVREVLEEAREEFSNVFEPIPSNLESPNYEVLARSAAWSTGDDPFEGYEVRAYEPYVAAATSIQGGEAPSTELERESQGFNTLASYIFGGNEANAKIAMTVPVEMNFPSEEMRFPLPKSSVESAEFAPRPKEESGVAVSAQDARVLAVRRFPGIATSQEVKRQVDMLVADLVADKILDDAEAAATDYSVFQYNPPYTIVFIRRNEVAVEIAWPAGASPVAEDEAEVEEEAFEDIVDEVVDEAVIDEVVDEAVIDEVVDEAVIDEVVDEAVIDEVVDEEDDDEDDAPSTAGKGFSM